MIVVSGDAEIVIALFTRVLTMAQRAAYEIRPSRLGASRGMASNGLARPSK
jgi:hypothetical protein